MENTLIGATNWIYVLFDDAKKEDDETDVLDFEI